MFGISWKYSRFYRIWSCKMMLSINRSGCNRRGVRVFDLEKESNRTSALNFDHALLRSYHLRNWLLRPWLLILLKMKFFNDVVWCLVAFLLFAVISYTSAFQYNSWVIMQENPVLIKLNCLFIKMSFYRSVGAAAHIHTICSHTDFPFFNF